MSAKRLKPLVTYSEQDRQVLLTGVPISPVSTRFGHPIHGWNLEAIRVAWQQLARELLIEWQGDKYAHHRARYDSPFAVRLLEGIE